MPTSLVALLLADVASGPDPMWILSGVALVVLAFLGFVAARLAASKRARLEGDEDAPRLDTERAAAPDTDPLADREEVKAPVRVTEGMSLREIKEARRARLSEDYKASDAVAAEKERRKGRRTDDASNTGTAETAPTADTPDAPAPASAPADAAADPAEATDAVSTAPVVPSEPEPAPEPAPEAEQAPEPAAAPEAEQAPEPVAAPEAEPEPEPAPEPTTTPEPEQAPEPAAAPEPEPAPTDTAPTDTAPTDTAPTDTAPTDTDTDGAGERTLAEGLSKTRSSGFLARIGRVFGSKTKLDDEVIEELEEVLFTADIGVQTSQKLLQAVQSRFEAGDLEDPQLVWAVLRQEIERIFDAEDPRLDVDTSKKPFVVMVVGVNGAGKTTSIGKIAARWSRQGHRVMMVAGDTFRAAAVDQLVEWGDRVGCPVHRGEDGADPSSVVFDGLQRAVDEGIDVVLVDTAGRLQTKRPLMDELQKIGRVADKAVPGAPHQTILVLDANTGQNAIQQARLFGEATPLSGLVLTKLDGTAKGGVVIGIRDELGLPIYYIGIGEAVDDLRPFHAAEFVDALF